MKIVKRLIKLILCFLLIPVLYLILSLLLSAITIEQINENQVSDRTIYLGTNGIHLDVIIPKENIDSLLLMDLERKPSDNYLSFGWGDEDFYINTPNWSDLTFRNAFNAMFLKSTTLMHVTRYKSKRADWIEISITENQLKKLNRYLIDTFQVDENGMKIILENQGYTSIDDFYRANGSYSCFNTCNSWVNTGFKESGLKACWWTPFDFGLLKKYQ